MTEWESVRTRLEQTKRVTPGLVGDTATVEVRLADIRAALQRVSELERERDEWKQAAFKAENHQCDGALKRAEAAEAKLKDAQDQMADIAASNADHVRWHREMEAKLAEAQEEMTRVFDRLEAGTLHRLVCNADQSKPTGGDMCICNPLKAKLARCVEALEQMVERWAPHSGLCCTFTDGNIEITPQTCVCETMHKRARAALAAAKGE